MNPISQILCVTALASGFADQEVALYASSAAAIFVELLLRYAALGDE